jgi:hypothetical protein
MTRSPHSRPWPHRQRSVSALEHSPFISMAASPCIALAPSRAANALSSTLHTSIGHSLLRIWQDQLGPPLFSQGLRPLLQRQSVGKGLRTAEAPTVGLSRVGIEEIMMIINHVTEGTISDHRPKCHKGWLYLFWKGGNVVSGYRANNKFISGTTFFTLGENKVVSQ